jgi:hypothetical protein
MKQWLLAGLVLTLSACSNTDKELTTATGNEAQQMEQQANTEQTADGQEIAKAETKTKVKCEYIKTIGSNMKRKVCKSKEYKDKQRDAAWEYMMRSQFGNTANSN